MKSSLFMTRIDSSRDLEDVIVQPSEPFPWMDRLCQFHMHDPRSSEPEAVPSRAVSDAPSQTRHQLPRSISRGSRAYKALLAASTHFAILSCWFWRAFFLRFSTRLQHQLCETWKAQITVPLSRFPGQAWLCYLDTASFKAASLPGPPGARSCSAFSALACHSQQIHEADELSLRTQLAGPSSSGTCEPRQAWLTVIAGLSRVRRAVHVLQTPSPLAPMIVVCVLEMSCAVMAESKDGHRWNLRVVKRLQTNKSMRICALWGQLMLSHDHVL